MSRECLPKCAVAGVSAGSLPNPCFYFQASLSKGHPGQHRPATGQRLCANTLPMRFPHLRGHAWGGPHAPHPGISMSAPTLTLSLSRDSVQPEGNGNWALPSIF